MNLAFAPVSVAWRESAAPRERSAWREEVASRLPSPEGPGVGLLPEDKLPGNHCPGKTPWFQIFRQCPLALGCSCGDPSITRGIAVNPPPAPPRRGAAMRPFPAMRSFPAARRFPAMRRFSAVHLCGLCAPPVRICMKPFLLQNKKKPPVRPAAFPVWTFNL